MTIGDKIKDSRKKQKITQKKLAEMTGIAEITIRQYEANKYNPKIENLKKISSALNTNIGEFLNTNQPLQEYHTESNSSITNTLTTKDNDNVLLQTELHVYSSQTADISKLNDALQKYYSMLNLKGKNEAVKRISELTAFPQYTNTT